MLADDQPPPEASSAAQPWRAMRAAAAARCASPCREGCRAALPLALSLTPWHHAIRYRSGMPHTTGMTLDWLATAAARVADRASSDRCERIAKNSSTAPDAARRRAGCIR